jgi:ribosomal protein L25 (general stress protein Ctc)
MTEDQARTESVELKLSKKEFNKMISSLSTDYVSQLDVGSSQESVQEFLFRRQKNSLLTNKVKSAVGSLLKSRNDSLNMYTT